MPAAEVGPLGGERVEIRSPDDRVIRGEIVVEATDGGLLIELDDGRYELFQPDQIARRETAPAVDPEPPDQLGRRILAQLPPGFEVLATKHYVICYATSRDYARWCGSVFERLHDAFGNYWRRAGLEVADPRRPLVVVIFADRPAYEAHAAAALGGAAGRVAGYYDMLTNRVTTYDLTGSDALASAGGGGAGGTGLAVLGSPAAAGLVATLVHEATHQLAFNGGLHRRLAPVPLWVSEGLATYFEAPDLRHARGWNGIGEVNAPRLERFLQSHRPGTLESLVRDDEPLRLPETALDGYAAAWAVTHHLLETRRDAYVAYLRLLAAKRPLADDSPASREQEFRVAFGDPAEVERQAFKAATRLASQRQR
ncbi:MAG: DUF1570 domain-containing protein [Planctomycetota bacterium]